jgi:hypothetical protein
MTLDALDQAFVDRWRSRASTVASAPRAAPVPPPDSIAPPNPLVARLLEAAAEQWNKLADELAAVRLAGHRVIAVTGGERGEGRTTLVTCLAAVLRGRGREVTVCGAHELAACPEDVFGGGLLHDGRIIMIDAGIWFPPGPIRRERLLVASLGCDAAILVRRADRAAASAWGVALAAVGVEPLGEVITFASAHGAPREAAA